MAEWERDTKGIQEITVIAKHYNIYSDLFGDKIFHPVVHMEIDFNTTDPSYVNPVYYGNELTPCAVSSSTLTLEAKYVF